MPLWTEQLRILDPNSILGQNFSEEGRRQLVVTNQIPKVSLELPQLAAYLNEMFKHIFSSSLIVCFRFTIYIHITRIRDSEYLIAGSPYGTPNVQLNYAQQI